MQIENCLLYALKFWSLNPEYKIYYNGDHVINATYDVGYNYSGFIYIRLEEYGYEYIVNSFKEVLDDYHLALLNLYFKKGKDDNKTNIN